MYNGIGLLTPRGSGTNGYVQRNVSAIKHMPAPSIYDAHKLPKTERIQREKNKEIQAHEAKRRIEIEILLKREELEAAGVDADEIERNVKKLHDELTAKQKKQTEFLEKNPEKIQPSKRLEDFCVAFGVSQDYKEGEAFDKELQEQQKQQKVLERERLDQEAILELKKKYLDVVLMAKLAEKEEKKKQKQAEKEKKRAEKEQRHAEKEAKKEEKRRQQEAEDLRLLQIQREKEARDRSRLERKHRQEEEARIARERAMERERALRKASERDGRRRSRDRRDRHSVSSTDSSRSPERKRRRSTSRDHRRDEKSRGDRRSPERQNQKEYDRDRSRDRQYERSLEHTHERDRKRTREEDRPADGKRRRQD
eukprot:TRINITY_DN1860_c0_g1_i1.p1 TRINITY_DN1860_c0_g1~~TRINITY_DN1860_c0_g1_i1.p1  ORF type:complete len:367 (-),score=90.46 TRINITY_DN1860_c0_g1_i1:18-1118(-)